MLRAYICIRSEDICMRWFHFVKEQTVIVKIREPLYCKILSRKLGILQYKGRRLVTLTVCSLTKWMYTVRALKIVIYLCLGLKTKSTQIIDMYVRRHHIMISWTLSLRPFKCRQISCRDEITPIFDFVVFLEKTQNCSKGPKFALTTPWTPFGTPYIHPAPMERLEWKG